MDNILYAVDEIPCRAYADAVSAYIRDPTSRFPGNPPAKYNAYRKKYRHAPHPDDYPHLFRSRHSAPGATGGAAYTADHIAALMQETRVTMTQGFELAMANSRRYERSPRPSRQDGRRDARRDDARTAEARAADAAANKARRNAARNARNRARRAARREAQQAAGQDGEQPDDVDDDTRRLFDLHLWQPFLTMLAGFSDTPMAATEPATESAPPATTPDFPRASNAPASAESESDLSNTISRFGGLNVASSSQTSPDGPSMSEEDYEKMLDEEPSNPTPDGDAVMDDAGAAA
ncbi:uncharacterized protein SCHCODRAFT_02673445 [Schizophyllum commune H4-8]|uniref:uncharacterized protein n=1 Tax=Schizophyllum commune (strain H4-8 / FGSC 9210) TaxID=578458 RepID=UPI00216091EC|nr:uncharacterized protein SCHCODRAFT_02673445 [Schizophyllum commune H4-8]KAI5885736.1 hypothetical protein SCHCODRAFT_02673445 [Schizophyllum commune H4-8]